MTLYMIGLGLSDEKDITVKGLETLKSCDVVYLEDYTSLLQVPKEKLEAFYGKKIILANREFVEQKADILLEKAKEQQVAFLVVGDPMGATTHVDLMLRAKEKQITVEIVHNASILNAVGVVGLQLYKYGKTASIPYPQGRDITTPYDVLKQNQSLGLHTVELLDIKKDQDRFMTVNEAIQILLDIEKKKKEGVFTKDTLCIGCARIGSKDQLIKVGKAQELVEIDFGKPPHCLIIPGKMHFMEEEALDLWKL